jgi:methylamine dehydrogenase accessory protein MauD
MMTLAVVGLWLVVGCLALVVAGLARQIGLLHRRIAPAGARMMIDGPAVGDTVASAPITDIYGRVHDLPAPGLHTLLVFMAPGCEVCADLLPSVKSLVKSERSWLRVVLISLSETWDVNDLYVRSHSLESIPLIASKQLATDYGVSAPPYGVIVGPDVQVISKGIVGHFEHLESLINSARLGYDTLEAYMKAQAPPQEQPAAGAL